MGEAIIRLYSRYLYIYRDKVGDFELGATDMRTFSRKTGIPYNRLRYWFVDLGLKNYDCDEFQIFRLETVMIFNRNS